MSSTSEETRLALSRLRLRVPSARSILITSPRKVPVVHDIARDFAVAAARMGQRSRLVNVETCDEGRGNPPSDERAGDVEIVHVPASDCFDPARLRNALSGPELTFCGVDGLLERSEALLLAAAVDAVVLVARRGTTSRDDLTRARAEIGRYGNELAGAIYLE